MPFIREPEIDATRSVDELEEILDRYVAAITDQVRGRVTLLEGLAASPAEMQPHLAELRRLKELLDTALAHRAATEAATTGSSRATWNLRHLSHQVEKFLANFDPA